LQLSSPDYQKILSFLKTPLAQLTEDLADNATFKRGIIEIQEVMKHIDLLNTTDKLHFVYDPFIIRGLDYYTGTVYETFFDDDMGLGSISSGGRYENLTGYIDPKKNFYS